MQMARIAVLILAVIQTAVAAAAEPHPQVLLRTSAGDIRIELKHHHHSSLLTAETLQLNIALGVEPHRTEAGLQQIGIPKICWQDGEMGHGHHDREP